MDTKQRQLDKLSLQIDRYCVAGKPLAAGSAAQRKFHDLQAEYHKLFHELHPPAQDSIQRLLEDVRLQIFEMRTETDQTIRLDAVAQRMQKLHLRADDFGIAKLPAYPKDATMRPAAATAYLLELRALLERLTPATAATPNSFLTKDMRDMTGLKNTALGKYANRANIIGRGRGIRNFRYTHADAVNLLRIIIEACTDTEVVNKCRQSIAKITS